MTINLDNDICDMAMNIISNANQSKMLMEHLFANLMQVVGQQQALIVEFTNRLVHPIQLVKFHQIYNGQGMGLQCMQDFLNKKDGAQRLKTKRKLQMDYAS
jgi:hypothetical protein